MVSPYLYFQIFFRQLEELASPKTCLVFYGRRQEGVLVEMDQMNAAVFVAHADAFDNRALRHHIDLKGEVMA